MSLPSPLLRRVLFLIVLTLLLTSSAVGAQENKDSAPTPVGDVKIESAGSGSDDPNPITGRGGGGWDDPVGPAAACASGSYCWYEGGTDAGSTFNCIGGYNESLGRSWVGWRGNLDSNPTKPQTGDVYYTKIGWGVAGFPCGSGGAYVHIELYLPANTQLAISANNPVKCIYYNLQGQAKDYTNDTICPQSPSAGQKGGLSFSPKTGDHVYPTATGAMWEILIPVKSTAPVTSGYSSTGPCPACVGAAVWMIDGNYSPWSYPRTGVYVDGPGTMPPTVSYPTPSVRNVQYSPDETNWPGQPSYAETVAHVSTAGRSGTGWFEIGPTKDYGYTSPPANIANGNWEYWQAWRMEAGQTWHWRFCFDPSDAAAICGADQTFETAPPPDNTAPQTTLTKKPPRWTNKTTANFAFESNELNVQFWCNLTWIHRCESNTQKYSDLAEGQHTFVVYAQDAAGNSGYDHRQTWTWNVDLTKPETTIGSGPPAKTKARKATFQFSSSEPGTFLCSLDGGKFSKCSSGKTYERLSRGSHTFKVKAKDRAGNLDGTPATHTWKVTA